MLFLWPKACVSFHLPKQLYPNDNKKLLLKFSLKVFKIELKENCVFDLNYSCAKSVLSLNESHEDKLY